MRVAETWQLGRQGIDGGLLLLIVYKDRIIRMEVGYERKSENRVKAIEIHGTKCAICGFDFETVYGGTQSHCTFTATSFIAKIVVAISILE